jgi:hypothetical protein
MSLSQEAEELSMLRAEVELLMREREGLLKIAGAAAAFVANTDPATLPEGAYEAADVLAESLNAVPEETLHDALASVKAEVQLDIVDRRKRHRYKRT